MSQLRVISTLAVLVTLLALNGNASPTAVKGVSTRRQGDKSSPNLVYILLDDLDVLLGGEVALKQTHELISSQGARFTHFRTHSPKCTPSRTGQLVGRLYQNVRPNFPSSVGPGLNMTTMFEPTALFPILKSEGYLTSIVGKVHNAQAKWLCSPGKNRTDAFSHISTQCRPCGGYWNANFTVMGLNETTTHRENLDPNDIHTYSHGQYSNRSIDFIKQAVALDKPFFAYIGTTGPHLPVVPAPWHDDTVRSWNKTVSAPRTPNFNQRQPDNHPTIAALPALDKDALGFVDQHMRNRLGTVLSIDDLVANVVHALDTLGVLNNTYIFFSSDHGYHLGQMRLPMEKMWPWETDVRIPFYVRGPGIKAGQELDVMGLNVDIAPTMLDLAGISIPGTYDGKSLRPLIMGDELSQKQARAGWRTRTVTAFAEGAVQLYGQTTMWSPNGDAWTTVHPTATAPDGVAYEFDNPQNQWRMLRVANESHDFAYVEWDPKFVFDKIAFQAFFDIKSDPWQQHNLWTSLSSSQQRQLEQELGTLFTCHGTATAPSNCP
eukprot:m.96369 g.96369  ORF g.96369 m.96369 type:complete len:547 (+) comp15188_c0_seq1:275-1915(+)